MYLSTAAEAALSLSLASGLTCSWTCWHGDDGSSPTRNELALAAVLAGGTVTPLLSCSCVHGIYVCFVLETSARHVFFQFDRRHAGGGKDGRQWRETAEASDVICAECANTQLCSKWGERRGPRNDERPEPAGNGDGGDSHINEAPALHNRFSGGSRVVGKNLKPLLTLGSDHSFVRTRTHTAHLWRGYSIDRNYITTTTLIGT